MAIAAILCIPAMNAETVSQKQAKKIAAQFFNAAHKQIMAEPKLVYNGRRLTTNNLFPPFYIYNLQAGGYVIISAENKAYPILGYSLTENFDPNHIGVTEKELLRLYAIHIENIRYDSSIPYEAEQAWANIPLHIAEILDAPYRATDPLTTKEEATVNLEAILDMEDSYGFASSSYTPAQWLSSIELELDSHPDVTVGLIKGEELLPAIVYGHKGPFYKIELDGRKNALWRLLPTEILSKGQVAVLGTPSAISVTPQIEEPHSFYETFVEEIQHEQDARQADLERRISIAEPKIQWHGGGHFTVSLPEELIEMRLYSLDGTQVQQEKFRETTIGSVNLTGQPAGFYFAVFFGKSGTPYSFKIFR